MDQDKHQSSVENGVRVEAGIVVGTASNKYQMKNPLARYLIRGFDTAIGTYATRVQPEKILEIGAGEGHVTEVLLKHTTADIIATDLSQTVLAIAEAQIESPRVRFQTLDMRTLTVADWRTQLVVCCEVLEHLEDPEEGLALLARMTSPYAILSVPREPLFRGLNFLRGAYVKDFGNSPGHLQHWSKTAFVRFVKTQFDVLAIAAPLPWTVVLARSKHEKA